jgi:hypothetical protein
VRLLLPVRVYLESADSPPGFNITPTGRSESEADSTVCIAVALSAGIILTTIHTQDFKDVAGDSAAGRVTLPIAYPTMSRVSTALSFIAWSWCVSRTWRLDDVTAAIMGVLALFVGLRFVALTDVRADKVSFHWYNVSPPSAALSNISHYYGQVWLCAVYSLPVYHRLRLVS